MRKLIVPVAALAAILATAGASAQDSGPQHGTTMRHMTPMQGGMCGPGGCGMGAPGQGTPMQGQAQGQGAMAMGSGCPMIQRSAAMEQRLRRLEERMGMPTPPAAPNNQPGSPG